MTAEKHRRNKPVELILNKQKSTATVLGSTLGGCYCTKYYQLIALISTSDRPPPSFPPPPAVLGSVLAPPAFPLKHKRTCRENRAGFVSSTRLCRKRVEYLGHTEPLHHLRERARFGNNWLVYLFEKAHLCLCLLPHSPAHLRGVCTRMPTNSGNLTNEDERLLQTAWE